METGKHNMRVIFRSKDFVSVEALGFGFNNRRPMPEAWRYHGRVQHQQWEGIFECGWDNGNGRTPQAAELVWSVTGDARLFGLAAALKSRGFAVEVAKE